MKYFAIDIETTGLDPEKHQIIQVAMIYGDTEKIEVINKMPYMVCRVQHEQYCFADSPAWVMKNFGMIMSDGYGSVIHARELMHVVEQFIIKYAGREGKITLAGKNLYALDLPFLDKHGAKWRMNAKQRYAIEERRHKRVIDLGSMYMCDLPGEALPDMEQITKRIVWTNTNVHDAYADAQAVVAAINYKYTTCCELIELPMEAHE
jgi:oligoribonuclease